MRFERPVKSSRGVPIVPMIDILFIVLIFLIVSTTFKKPRTILPIELPTVHEIASTEVIDERSVLAVIHVLCHHTCYALDAQLVSPAVANLAKRTNSATPAQAHGGPVPLCTHCGLG